MPRFYIDTDDGDTAVIDEEGYTFADQYEARRAAIAALPDMVNDKLPNGDDRDFSVSVRNEGGTVIYKATLGMHGEWLVPSPVAT